MTQKSDIEKKRLDSAQLLSISQNAELLEIGRKAVEEILVGLRDDGIFTIRNNGLVIRNLDGAQSSVIRLGPEDAIRIGLQAIAEHLAAKGTGDRG